MPAYRIIRRVANTLTIRFSRETVLAHYRQYGDQWPFLPDFRVGCVVHCIENRPAVVVERFTISSCTIQIVLQWISA